MSYLFKVRLCGHVCDECFKPLSKVKVRLYHHNNEKDSANLAAADPKTTFAQLSDAEVKQKSAYLLAEGMTDHEGKIDLQLDDQYDGGAFDIDIQIDHPKQGKGKKRQYLHITTLAPTWRKGKIGAVATWDYCLPKRIWCLILALLGRWVICGSVVHCETKKPIGGVEVSAFDRDWLQDDSLGKAMTNSNGRFLIEYTKDDFISGTWIDVEMFGGPDLYFHVHHPSGAELLIEPPSKGREAGRENVGHCFCTTLCLDEYVAEEDDNYPLPVFTHVGGYNYQTKIDSNPGESGLTSTSNRAFYSTLRLNGTLPKKFSGEAMEYRFDVRELQPDGSTITAWTSVAMSQISRTVIGQLLKYAPAYSGDPNPIKAEAYTVNGHPSELNANVVDGWIQVPQQSNTFGESGFFVANGNQINLNTKALGGWVDKDLTGLIAGSSSTSTGQPLTQNRYFALRMRVRAVGDAASEQVAGVCQHIAINNSLYDNISRHPDWMEQKLSNQLSVAMMDISQLIGDGCSGIGNDLDITFTATHPSIGNVLITMSGPGGPYDFTLPPAVSGERYGVAVPDGFVVADLDPCAYIVTLKVEILLTTGDTTPDDQLDQIAFCKI